MKQTYIQPTATIVKIHPAPLLSASLGNGEDPQNINYGEANVTNETSGNLSRKRSFWDDDWD